MHKFLVCIHYLKYSITLKWTLKSSVIVSPLLWKHMFVCVDSLRPSQQFFSYVGTGLPELNQ